MAKISFLASFALLGVSVATSPALATASGTFSETDAARLADATQAAWVSMDIARFEAPYSKDIVSFDPTSPLLVADWSGFHQIQVIFARAKVDGLTVPDRKIQLLDDSTFIVSGTGQATSKTGPQKRFSLRFSDVYHRQTDGQWLIVNEHISLVPRR
ncbi:MAG: DUF4440 domain-containing protein [Sphingomonadales bacterium]|nr:DUF4440 domain-containing protein [Sphingomonadales bacterium]